MYSGAICAPRSALMQTELTPVIRSITSNLYFILSTISRRVAVPSVLQDLHYGDQRGQLQTWVGTNNPNPKNPPKNGVLGELLKSKKQKE